MYIFLFWPFRVIGFILTLYLLSYLAKSFNISFNEPSFLGSIAIAFSIPLVALFWIDFPKYYFKIFPGNDYSKKTKKGRKNSRKNDNLMMNLLKGIYDTFDFFFGWAVPFVILFIIITILATLI